MDTPSGTIILSSTSLLIGFQLLLSALNYDMRNIPSEPLSRLSILRKFKVKL